MHMHMDRLQHPCTRAARERACRVREHAVEQVYAVREERLAVVRVAQAVLEAVLIRRRITLAWRDLKNDDIWRIGWQ